MKNRAIPILLSIALGAFSSAASALDWSRVDDETSGGERAAMLPSNDGFLEVEQYVMNGPRYLICPPEQNPRVWIEDGHCVRPTGSDFLKRSKREEVRALSPQEYLDARFGKGETIFAGLGGRVSGLRKFLVLYYRIQQN